MCGQCGFQPHCSHGYYYQRLQSCQHSYKGCTTEIPHRKAACISKRKREENAVLDRSEQQPGKKQIAKHLTVFKEFYFSTVPNRTSLL